MNEYHSVMSTLAQIETSIETLPTQDFLALADWMTDRHLKMLATDEFESAELEAELLAAIDSPRHPANDEFFASVRNLAAQDSDA